MRTWWRRVIWCSEGLRALTKRGRKNRFCLSAPFDNATVSCAIHRWHHLDAPILRLISYAKCWSGALSRGGSRFGRLARLTSSVIVVIFTGGNEFAFIVEIVDVESAHLVSPYHQRLPFILLHLA